MRRHAESRPVTCKKLFRIFRVAFIVRRRTKWQLWLLLQLLSRTGGGCVNSSSLQPSLLLLRSPCFKIACEMSSFIISVLVNLLQQCFVFRVFLSHSLLGSSTSLFRRCFHYSWVCPPWRRRLPSGKVSSFSYANVTLQSRWCSPEIFFAHHPFVSTPPL